MSGSPISTTMCWSGQDADSGSASDPALLAALKAPRGSTMRDIVTTIQAEQDAIIRLPLSGVVVIEGGPGTGKTAVALHRVAYLLYTHRERLARSGVLVVGPAPGSSGTSGACSPRWASRRWCSPPPAGWRTASSRPPSIRTRWPARRAGWRCWTSCAAPSPTGRSYPGRRSRSSSTTSPSRSTVRRRPRRGGRARATGLPHNAARATFRDTLGSLLVQQGVERLDQDLEDPPELAEHPPRARRPPGDRAGGRGAGVGGAAPRAARRPALGPRLPRGGRAALAGADPGAAPRRALRVAGPAGVGRRRDRPLRAAPRPTRAHPRGRWRTRRCSTSWPSCSVPRRPAGWAAAVPPDSAYAAEVLSILESADRQLAGEDPDELRPTDFVTADVLAARQVPEHLMSVAERAAADRDWRYGHLVVDEAQELSAMDWHVLLPALPVPFDHRGGRSRPAQRPRGSARVGGRARPAAGSPVDLPDAHGGLPDACRDHGAGRCCAGRVRAQPAAARIGAGDGRGAVAAHRARDRPRGRGARGRRHGGGAAGPRDAGGDRRRHGRPGRPGRSSRRVHTPVSAKGSSSTPS